MLWRNKWWLKSQISVNVECAAAFGAMNISVPWMTSPAPSPECLVHAGWLRLRVADHRRRCMLCRWAECSVADRRRRAIESERIDCARPPSPTDGPTAASARLVPGRRRRRPRSSCSSLSAQQRAAQAGGDRPSVAHLPADDRCPTSID